MGLIEFKVLSHPNLNGQLLIKDFRNRKLSLKSIEQNFLLLQ